MKLKCDQACVFVYFASTPTFLTHIYSGHCMHAEASGFTCDKCSRLRRAKRNAHTRPALREASEKLKKHLQTVLGARKGLAKYKFMSTRDEGFCLVMADAADQAKQGSPIIREGGRAGTSIKKIKQQFIGVLIHGVGYFIYRRLPVSTLTHHSHTRILTHALHTYSQVTPKGANLTATIVMDLFAKGHLRNAHTLVLQWDGL